MITQLYWKLHLFEQNINFMKNQVWCDWIPNYNLEFWIEDVQVSRNSAKESQRENLIFCCRNIKLWKWKHFNKLDANAARDDEEISQDSQKGFEKKVSPARCRNFHKCLNCVLKSADSRRPWSSLMVQLIIDNLELAVHPKTTLYPPAELPIFSPFKGNNQLSILLDFELDR